jgi:hypothetical protein
MSRTVLLLLALGVAGCSRTIEVEKVMKVTDFHTGWYDAGIVADGKNKLVPSISLRLQNVSSEAVRSVQLVAIFRQVSEPDVAWGEHYARAIDREGLASGSNTNPIVLRSNLGYTGTQPRMQMLQNREFVDAKVEVFARHGAQPLAKLGEYKIDRQLLTQ